MTTAVKALDPSVAVITVPPSVLGSSSAGLSGAGRSAATADAGAERRAEPAFVDLTFVARRPDRHQRRADADDRFDR